MADNQESDLARVIVEAYRGSGIPAKLHRGGIYLARERGWEGPLELQELLPIYLEEIRQIERAARVEVTRCLDLATHALKEWDGFRETWISLHISPECFQALGFSLETAELYVNVACQLHFNRKLWD